MLGSQASNIWTDLELNAIKALMSGGEVDIFHSGLSLFEFDGNFGIGVFTEEKPIFHNVVDTLQGIEIRNNNPAIVLRDESGEVDNLISLQAGSAAGSNKFILKDEMVDETLFRIDNSNNWDIYASRLTLGDGTGVKEFVIMAENGAVEAAVLSFYETSYENNGLQLAYDSGGNCLYLYDWTGGVKDNVPLMKICRSRDSIRLENLDFIERSTDPAKPPEGETAIWMSNGAGLGDDGDLIIASTVSGVTKYKLLFDYSTGTVW